MPYFFELALTSFIFLESCCSPCLQLQLTALQTWNWNCRKINILAGWCGKPENREVEFGEVLRLLHFNFFIWVAFLWIRLFLYYILAHNGAKLLLCFLLPFILNFLYEDSGVETNHNQPGPSVHTMVLLIIILMYVSYVHSYYPKIGQIRIISLYLLYFFNFLFSCLTNSLINTKYRIATRKDWSILKVAALLRKKMYDDTLWNWIEGKKYQRNF